MNEQIAFRIAAVTGCLGVALGAFGAHALKTQLEGHYREVWETAVFYHLIHAVMLAVVSQMKSWNRGPYLCFLAGILLFSGSLYLLAVTQVRWLGAITPFGGLSFLAGWLWLAIAGFRGATK